MTPISRRCQMAAAECAAMTLATLANLNMADDVEQLAGRLSFLEDRAEMIIPTSRTVYARRGWPP